MILLNKEKIFVSLTLILPAKTVIDVFFSGLQSKDVELKGFKHKIITEIFLFPKIKNSYPHGLINTLFLKKQKGGTVPAQLGIKVQAQLGISKYKPN